ncbi:MAG: flagellar hook-associated family protein [Mesorhizobium sp.]
MKASFVSSVSISNAMRYQVSRMQSELVKAQKETSSDRVADAGLSLGARTGQLVSVERDLERLDGIVKSNDLAKVRLSATQTSFGQLATTARTLLTTLMASSTGNPDSSVVLSDAKNALSAMTSVVNTTVNGQYIFAGINTDVKPLNDFNAPGSPSKAALDAAFQSYFGFTQTDAQAANITTAQMDSFLTTAIEPMFMGAGWKTSWSNASDQKIVSRIALNETAETSVSANNDGVRRLAMACATISGLFTAQMSADAKKAIIDRQVDQVGQAIGNISTEQALMGFTENRVKSATDRLTMQKDLLDRSVLDMVGIDPYEVANRITTLVGQIDKSYALTARIQQLSLLKYL